MDAEIRTLIFEQGVEVSPPPLDTDSSNKKELINNGSTDIDALSYNLLVSRAVVIDYFIERFTTGGGFRSISGQIKLSSNYKDLGFPSQWKIIESQRFEDITTDFGITFSLVAVGSGICKLRATLDNMSGTGHICTMYFKTAALLA